MSAPGDIIDPNARILFEVGASAIVFSVYDTIINLADEVQHIWRAPHSWVKWTYLFVRHFPYIAQVTIISLLGASRGGGDWNPESCRDMIAYQFTVMEVTTIAVEIILIMRVYAMYHSNRRLLTIILFLFLAEVAAMLTVIGLSLPKLGFTPQCLIISTPSYFTSYWLISLTFETLLFILTLVKFSRAIQQDGSRGEFLTVLVRDGTWAYAIIFAVMLLNTLMFDLIKNTLAGVCYFWELSVMSFAGSHMLLNIRRMAHNVAHPPTEDLPGVSENIDFANRVTSGYYDSTVVMTQTTAGAEHRTEMRNVELPKLNVVA
ncbi:hypothetical protein CERSUDRAFT_114449 [Gelatoporia subvermispora B]|uniref:DUF6533 domain-containing protein n=1 Tax=Ceriporiopsis subvermispora (strain B) TaxID=914234 RepID=M2QZV6_CERS8|nr:hypothetical protein CERSUDRAFT_114449 [Gelatoporia subvermispora B]